MRRSLESYRLLRSAVGGPRARQLSRAELVIRGARRLGGPAWDAVEPPGFGRLVTAMPVLSSAEDVLAWAGVPAERVLELTAEFAQVGEELQAAYARTALTCPPEWAVERSTSLVLYALVREQRPERVVETGIANGHSSFVILSALRANGSGRLASIDVRHDVGGLVTPELAERWSTVIMDGDRPGIDALEAGLGEHRPVQLFFHDGDHRYLGQMLDLALADRLLSPGGVLMSDDIETTAAWLDASASGLVGEDAVVLFDRRKAVGLARKPA